MTIQFKYCQINFRFREVQVCVLRLRGVILNTYYKFRNKTLSLCRNILLLLVLLLLLLLLLFTLSFE